ncbi:hypothetical protein AYM02_05915 [Coxiella burnetii]|nr:hypothetical protein AYM02_05915 [Coxiella burnetii]PNT82469.1 hypothetical protein C2L93_10815 [Coxiella burnetii]
MSEAKYGKTMMSIVLVFRFAHTGYLAPDPARGPSHPPPWGEGLWKGGTEVFYNLFIKVNSIIL